MKNVVNCILSAQKKIFVMAFLAVFSSFYTVVWGATYNYRGGFNSCRIAKTMVSEQTQFTLTMGVRAMNTSDGNNWSSTLTLILLSTDGTLEGTYSTTDDDNKITGSTNLVYNKSTRTPRTGITSSFTIEKIGAPDYCYRVSSGALYLTASSNEYNYTFCYSINGSGDVDDSSPSHYDFSYVKYAITGSSPNKTLTISGWGDMKDYSTGSAPWYASRSDIKYVVIQSGVKSVGEYAFQNCSTLVSVTIPTSCTSFGSNAFNNCMSVANIYYAGTPNQWAQITFSAGSSHPFNKRGTSNSCKFFFNGNTSTNTTNLIFTTGLTEIKAYAFCNAGTLSSVYIPGSVSYIGTYGLRSTFSEVYINRATRPDRDSNDKSFIGFTSTGTLYVPSGATSSYSTNTYGWKKHEQNNSLGYNSIQEVPVSGTVDSKDWSLSESGVLTIDGSGAITTTFADADGAGVSQYPYYYFRYLVDKVVVTGGVTALSNIIQRMEALRTLEFQQNNIPTKTATIPTDYIYADGTLKMLFPYTAVENVYPESWSSYKRQLFNAANIDQSEDNVSLLAALHNNLTEPFDMNLTRTLSNTMYNTYCSPIDMSAEEVTALFGEGTYLVELDAENTGMNEDDELVIAFKDATEIIAGTPYLIMPANNVANPSFTNVDPSKVAAEEGVVETEHVDFHGTLNKRTISETEIENQSIVILTASLSETTGYQLFNWANGGTLKGMRAYWELKSDKAKASIRRPVLRINYQAEGENTATGVEDVQSDNVQCTKVLRNGQIYLIYEGQMYDVQGKRIR